MATRSRIHAIHAVPEAPHTQVKVRGKTSKTPAPAHLATKGVAFARQHTSTSNNAGAALVSPDKPLTDMQKAFVRFWAQGDSIPSAAIKAGYNDGATYAYRMTRMPNVLALYNEEKKKYEEASQMTRKRVMDMHLEAFEMAKMVAEPSSMVAAAREIGRMCGYYEPVTIRHQVTHEGKVLVDRLNQLSDDELLRIIEERANAIQQLPAPAEA